MSQQGAELRSDLHQETLRVWAPGGSGARCPGRQGCIQDSQASGAEAAEVLNLWFSASENS